MATPTAASIATAKKAWEGMDAAGQQSFLKSNAGFDPNKYGFSPMKTATVTPPTPVAAPVTPPVTPPTPKVDNGTGFGANKVATPAPVQPVATPTPATPVQTQTPTPTQTIKPTPQKKVTTAETNTAITNKYASLDELKSSPGYATLTPDLQKKAEMAFNKGTETPTTPTNTQTNGVDKNKVDTPERLAEITTNLTGYTQSNPDIFKSIDTYHDFLDYDNRSQKQKDTIDNFWLSKGRQTSYNQMSADQLATGVVNGDFSETDLDYMKQNDPVKYGQFEQAKTDANNKLQANIAAQSYNALFGDADKNGTPDYIDKMNASTDASLKALQDYQDTKNSPEMLQATEDMKNLQAEIETAQVDQLDIKKDLEEQYGSLPKSLLNSMIADATNDLQSDITKKTIEYNAKLGIFNSKLAVAKDEYDMQTARLKADTDKMTSTLTAFQTMFNVNLQNAQLTKPDVSQNPLGTGAIITQRNPTTMSRDTTTQGEGNSSNNTNTNINNIDLSGLASEHPNEQSFKNNNPTGIKISAASPALQKLRADAGIKVETGTSATDGGSFAKFATIQDGMKAYDIAMTQRRGNATVGTYLKSRGTGDVGLSSDIMGKKINQLTADEKALVQSAQIKKESPGLWQELFGGGNTTPSDGNTSLYSQFDTLKNPTVAQLAQLGANNGISLGDVQKQRQTYQSTAGDREAQQFMNDYSNNIKESYSGTQWIDLSGMTPTDKTKLSLLANKAGILPILDKTQASKLANISTVMEDLANVQGSIQSYLPNTARDLVTKAQNIKAQNIPGADARSAAIASYGTRRNSAIAALQALVGGAGAGFRITQTEINMSIDNDIPKVTDPKNVATAKFTVLETLLASAENGVTGNKKVTRKDVITKVMKANPGMTYPDEYYTLTGIKKNNQTNTAPTNTTGFNAR